MEILVSQEASPLQNTGRSEFVPPPLPNPNLIMDITDDSPHEESVEEQPLVTADPTESKNKGRNFKKRQSDRYNWKCVERKRRYQAGEEYTSRRNKKVPKKVIQTKKDCTNTCKFRCDTKIAHEERKKIFERYYSLDQNRKYDFINKTTSKMIKCRSTKKDDAASRRNYTFKYYFFINDERKQVCKTFYLTTLRISQKTVYNVHRKKDKLTGVPEVDRRGTSRHKNTITEDSKQAVRDHINSFPAIESHYCRAKTRKKYLDSNLNISKMYDLYATECKNDNAEAVKETYYRHIFCNEFNIDFHVPKSDRCGTCEASANLVRAGQITEELKEQQTIHENEKNEMRRQKKEDKDSDVPVLIFDMENVLTCPRSEIGPLFYKSKLNIYNLTAYLTSTKTVYCAVWTEYTSGRTGNDIASAMVQILERVFRDNDINKLITWSDSCVPQNRNSIMSFAILNFLRTHSDVESIVMKFSVPGHSACQEVDNAHSAIERHLKHNEFFSPIGLFRLLKGVNRKKPFVVIPMQERYYKNYSECSKKLEFKAIPFSKVHMLQFTQSFYDVAYSFSYSENDCKLVSIKPLERKSSRIQEHGNTSIDLNQLTTVKTVVNDNQENITPEKGVHLISMFRYMSMEDLEYYKLILKMGDNEFQQILEAINMKKRPTASASNVPKKKKNEKVVPPKKGKASGKAKGKGKKK